MIYEVFKAKQNSGRRSHEDVWFNARGYKSIPTTNLRLKS